MAQSPTAAPKPVVLCILDGWGHREDPTDNAIAAAQTPTWDRWMAERPHCLIETSGLDVGLPSGQMGNSEVGHMNIGAGRVVMQDLPRIDQAVADGSLAQTPALTGFIDALKTSGGTAHVVGLMSPGGVHSHQDHILALCKTLTEAGIPVAIHAILDGRDTPPRSAPGFVERFEAGLDNGNYGRIATVSGRYFAMDRDNRWDRVAKAYTVLARAEGPRFDSAQAAIAEAHGRDETDEFVTPASIGTYAGMADGDGLLFANFRADRAREITRALAEPGFAEFEVGPRPAFANALSMTEYSKAHNAFLQVMFPPLALTDILGEVVSGAGKTQLRIAETEKYAHVTFFFNGGEEDPFPGEERILIKSPDVATYDLQPDMSAPEVTDNLVKVITENRFDLIIVNFANGDMVGHTGVMEAAVQAAACVDGCMTRLEQAVQQAGGVLFVTADHGNAELMKDPETGQPHTAHTVGKVDGVLAVGGDGASLRDGSLADIAPTLLQFLGLPQPAAMTGVPLVTATGDVNQADAAE
ncbi:MAG: 2,3-bisphosphoglycerate-independent phosphoglycerate mutase [Rhodospirillaceae bacterium]